MAVTHRLVLLAALVALPGCQLTIPNGLLDGLPRGGSITHKVEPTSAKPTDPPSATPGVDPIGGKPERPPVAPPIGRGEPDGPPLDRSAIGPPIGPPIGPRGGPFGACDENFARLDADQDGGLDFGELARWEVLGEAPAFQTMVPDCTRLAPEPMPAPNEPPPIGMSEEAWLSSNDAGARPIDAPEQAEPGCASQPPADALALFGKFDQDADKRLDPGEFCAFSDAWTAPPGAIGPGYPPPPPDYPPPPPDYPPSPPDYPPPPPIDPPVDACADEGADTNRDGLVDWGEYFEAHRHEADVMAVDYAVAKEQVYKRFAELDRNDDNFLDAAERCPR